MQRYTRPHKPRNGQCVFTEGINYFDRDENSIWGKGEEATLRFLRSARIRGRWLNLAAGDGRYNLYLLRKADGVVAADIDRSALSKLSYCTPKRYKPKLKTKAFNMTHRFPFGDNAFDGVFCTGVLHLFPKQVFTGISREMDRVLKPGGTIILDFSADIKRTGLDDRSITFGSEPRYSLREAKALLNRTFPGYRTRIIKSSVLDSKEGNPPYRFQCNFILLIATKGSAFTAPGRPS